MPTCSGLPLGTELLAPSPARRPRACRCSMEPGERRVVEPVPADLVDGEHAGGRSSATTGRARGRGRGRGGSERAATTASNGPVLARRGPRAGRAGSGRRAARAGRSRARRSPSTASAVVSSPWPQPTSSTRAGGCGSCSRRELAERQGWSHDGEPTVSAAPSGGWPSRRRATRAATAARHAASVEEAIRRLSCVQLDSISTVERSHRIALDEPRRRLPARRRLAAPRGGPDLRVLGARGVPAPDRVLAALPQRDGERRPRLVRQRRQDASPPRRARSSPRSASAGRSASRHFEGAAAGGMWNWKPAKAMLERLWNHGDLVIAGRAGLPARLRPGRAGDPARAARGARASEREVLRTFAEQAVRARGVLTDAGVKEHWRLKGGVARVRPAVDELVAEGRLRRLRVDDGGADVLVAAEAELDRPPPTRRRPALPVRQPALGPAVRAPDPRLRPPDRGLQAGAAAAVRLLRAPVPPRRPDRRPRRPQVGAEGRAARRPRVPPRGRRARLGRARRRARPRARAGSPARSGSRRCER